MVKYVCDHCGHDITDVMYVITPTSYDGHVLRNGYQLHYNCIIPWRLKDA